MSLSREDALQMIYVCLAEINAERPADSQLPLSSETPLLGSSAVDSLTFVNLIVALEGRLARRLRRPVVLVTDAVFEGDGKPFGDVDALATYVAELTCAE